MSTHVSPELLSHTPQGHKKIKTKSVKREVLCFFFLFFKRMRLTLRHRSSLGKYSQAVAVNVSSSGQVSHHDPLSSDRPRPSESILGHCDCIILDFPPILLSSWLASLRKSRCCTWRNCLAKKKKVRTCCENDLNSDTPEWIPSANIFYFLFSIYLFFTKFIFLWCVSGSIRDFFFFKLFFLVFIWF